MPIVQYKEVSPLEGAFVWDQFFCEKLKITSIDLHVASLAVLI